MLIRPDCAAIVKSVIGLARDLQISIVAEGVESAEQLDFLRQANCDEVQGYFIGRPVEAGHVLAFLGRHDENDITWTRPNAKFG